MRFGTAEQQDYFLPKIAAGEMYFCIGMSEPNSGSDLAGTTTRATKVQGGYVVNAEEKAKLQAVIWNDGLINAKAVAQPATTIAAMAGPTRGRRFSPPSRRGARIFRWSASTS